MFGLSSHAFDSKKVADILCQLYYSLCYLKQWIIFTASVKFTSSETHNMAAQGAVRFYFIALQQNGPRYLYPGFSPVRVVVVVWYLLQYLQRKLSKCRWTKSPKSVLFIMIKSTTIWAKEPRFKNSGDSATFYSNEHVYQRELVLLCWHRWSTLNPQGISNWEVPC